MSITSGRDVASIFRMGTSLLVSVYLPAARGGKYGRRRSMEVGNLPEDCAIRGLAGRSCRVPADVSSAFALLQVSRRDEADCQFVVLKIARFMRT